MKFYKCPKVSEYYTMRQILQSNPNISACKWVKQHLSYFLKTLGIGGPVTAKDQMQGKNAAWVISIYVVTLKLLIYKWFPK